MSASSKITNTGTSVRWSRRKRLLFGAVFLSLLVASVYPSLAHLKITLDRIRFLHLLATCRDPYRIRMHLGGIYVDAGEYDKAIECYRRAVPHGFKSLLVELPSLGMESLDQTCLPFAWERLDQEDPLSPSVHVGYGEMFQKCGDMKQAEMEYKQALHLSPQDREAREKLATIDYLKWSPRADSRGFLQREGPFGKFERDMALSWKPPQHEGCLVTRCVVTSDNNGLDLDQVVQLVGTSGSNVHDQSVLRFLQSAPCWSARDFRYSDIYTVGCMSDGKTKTIAITSEMGQWNEVQISSVEQLLWRFKWALKSFNKQIGASHL